MIFNDHQLTLNSVTSFIILALVLFITSCESRHTPRTVPDIHPPVVTVRISGVGAMPTYTIYGLGITPAPPYITPTFTPGTTFKAVVTAFDSIGLYNLRIGLNKDCFEFSDIRATPGIISTADMGDYSVIDVTLPISPAKTGTILTFSFRAKIMAPGTLAPFLGFNVIATDFGESGRSSNVSGYTIPMAYSSE